MEHREWMQPAEAAEVEPPMLGEYLAAESYDAETHLAAETNPSALLAALREIDSPLSELQIPSGSWALALTIVDSCESPGIEPDELAFLLRVVLYLDRLERSTLWNAQTARAE